MSKSKRKISKKWKNFNVYRDKYLRSLSLIYSMEVLTGFIPAEQVLPEDIDTYWLIESIQDTSDSKKYRFYTDGPKGKEIQLVLSLLIRKFKFFYTFMLNLNIMDTSKNLIHRFVFQIPSGQPEEFKQWRRNWVKIVQIDSLGLLYLGASAGTHFDKGKCLLAIAKIQSVLDKYSTTMFLHTKNTNYIKKTTGNFSWNLFLETLLEPAIWKEYENYDKAFQHPFLHRYCFVKRKLYPWIYKEFVQAIQEVALLQYCYAKETGSFKITYSNNDDFIRAYLKIPLDANVSSDYYVTFNEILQDFIKKKNLSFGMLFDRRQLFDPHLRFGSTKMPLIVNDKLNDFFRFMGIKKRITTAYRSNFNLDFIFGEIESIPDFLETFKGNKIFLQKTETVRSIGYILPIVSTQFLDKIMVREVSVEYTFNTNWKNCYKANYFSIINQLRQKTLRAYKFTNSKQIEQGKHLLIQEMKEVSIYYEIGCVIILQPGAFLTVREAGLLSAQILLGYNILCAVKSILADFAPLVEGKSGPLVFIINTYKNNPEKAKRMLYLYMSDYWFIGADDPHEVLTEIFFSLILPFIHKDGSIDFERLSQKKEVIFQFLLKEVKIMLNQLEQILQDAKYNVTPNESLNYTALEKHAMNIARQEEIEKAYIVRKEYIDNPEKFKEYGIFWGNILGYLQRFSDSSFMIYMDTLFDFKDYFRKQTLSFVKEELYDPSTPFAYTTLREYVISSLEGDICHLCGSPMKYIEAFHVDMSYKDEFRPAPCPFCGSKSGI